jgi:hypothetical protein
MCGIRVVVVAVCEYGEEILGLQRGLYVGMRYVVVTVSTFTD